MKKVALITGISGQDGYYLAEFLLEKGYEIHGIVRRSSKNNYLEITELFKKYNNNQSSVIYGDLADSSSISKIIYDTMPDEIYNLGAQSDVKISFDTPEYTSDIVALGALRILESIRTLRLTNKTKFYQASSSELFGLVREVPQNEHTPFYPRSPYAVAKQFAYWITVNYREAYKIHACNGILFNHESKRRGSNFVTRKISLGIVSISLGLQKCMYMGNIHSLRDWGHARDYVRMQWLMLQQDVPNDFIIATGIQYSVKDFIIKAALKLGIGLDFYGEGLDEIGVITDLYSDNKFVKVGDIIIRIDKNLFRPTEVQNLLGDSTKAKELLGWIPEVGFDQLIEEMISNDLDEAIIRQSVNG